jgi:hypothetical protein
MQFLSFWISLVAALIMAGGLAGIYYLAVKQNASIGRTAIQFLAVVFVLPVLLILGLAGVLRAETIGPLIGVMVGFVLTAFSGDHS